MSTQMWLVVEANAETVVYTSSKMASSTLISSSVERMENVRW
jgi:hypothetical protein